MNSAIWQFLTGIAFLVVLYMLVRPGSPAAQAIKSISDALQAMVSTATSYTFSGQ